MKVIFKNSSLVFQQAAQARIITTEDVVANTITGVITASTTSRYKKTGSTEFIPIAEHKVIAYMPEDYSHVNIFYYDSSQNFIAKAGDNPYDYITFTKDTPMDDIIDDIDTFSLNETAVSKSTIQSTAAYFRLCFEGNGDASTHYFGVWNV